MNFRFVTANIERRGFTVFGKEVVGGKYFIEYQGTRNQPWKNGKQLILGWILFDYYRRSSLFAVLVFAVLTIHGLKNRK